MFYDATILQLDLDSAPIKVDALTYAPCKNSGTFAVLPPPLASPKTKGRSTRKSREELCVVENIPVLMFVTKTCFYASLRL